MSNKTLKKVLKIAGNAINVILLVVLSVFLIYNLYSMYCTKKGNTFPMLAGIGTAIVTSGSMEPTINVNDLIVVREVDDYEVGDVITFADEYGSFVTHRIIGIDDSGKFRTKGDYVGNSEDSFRVPVENVIGKVVKVIPGYGKVQEFFSSTVGVVVLIIFVLIVIFAPNIWSVIKKTFFPPKPQEDANAQSVASGTPAPQAVAPYTLEQIEEPSPVQAVEPSDNTQTGENPITEEGSEVESLPPQPTCDCDVADTEIVNNDDE